MLERVEGKLGTLTEEQARAVLLAWIESPARLTALVRQHGCALAALDDGGEWYRREDPVPVPPPAGGGGNCGRDEERLLESAERELDGISRDGLALITPESDGWPAVLSSGWNPPSLLYVKGEMPPLDGRSPGLALVGSRRNVAYGMRIALPFASSWADMGGVVVSGGAAGVDTAAHKGALDRGGKTVAVAGTGLGKVYPECNRDLFDRIAAQGAIVSELPLYAAAQPFHFPERNRIIAGLARAVVIVQARKGSGALHTARFALKCGRMLFTVPGPVDDEVCAGGLELLSQGVEALTSTGRLAEIFARLTGAPLPASLPLPGRSPPVVSMADLDPASAQVLELLERGPMHVDDLSSGTGFTLAKTSLVLVGLELKGWVDRTPGNHYQCTVRLER